MAPTSFASFLSCFNCYEAFTHCIKAHFRFLDVNIQRTRRAFICSSSRSYDPNESSIVRMEERDKRFAISLRFRRPAGWGLIWWRKNSPFALGLVVTNHGFVNVIASRSRRIDFWAAGRDVRRNRVSTLNPPPIVVFVPICRPESKTSS
jgi:hypothetical protein